MPAVAWLIPAISSYLVDMKSHNWSISDNKYQLCSKKETCPYRLALAEALCAATGRGKTGMAALKGRSDFLLLLLASNMTLRSTC